MRKELGDSVFITAAVVLSFTLIAAVYAQTTPPAAPQGQTPSPSPGAPATPDPGQFSAHKQKLLQNIGEHIAKMQKKQSCISAAADEAALDACLSVKEDGSVAGGK